jgi:hypothetical protein
MYRLAVAAFFVCTPALAQNADALRECKPIGTTAGGETALCPWLRGTYDYKPNMPATELKDTVIPLPGKVQTLDQTRKTGANR